MSTSTRDARGLWRILYKKTGLYLKKPKKGRPEKRMSTSTRDARGF